MPRLKKSADPAWKTMSLRLPTFVAEALDKQVEELRSTTYTEVSRTSLIVHILTTYVREGSVSHA